MVVPVSTVHAAHARVVCLVRLVCMFWPAPLVHELAKGSLQWAGGVRVCVEGEVGWARSPALALFAAAELPWLGW